MTKNILLVDDHNIVLDGLKDFLEKSNGDFKVIGSASNGKEAVMFSKDNEIDLIIMDISMPVMDGLEATKQIIKLNSKQKILILSMFSDSSIIQKTMMAGARGYISKSSNIQELIVAINSILETGYYLNSTASKVLIDALVEKPFSAQNELNLDTIDSKIIELICKEKTSTEIAEELSLSPRTIEGRKKTLLVKMGVKNIVGLVIYAIKNGLVDVQKQVKVL